MKVLRRHSVKLPPLDVEALELRWRANALASVRDDLQEDRVSRWVNPRDMPLAPSASSAETRFEILPHEAPRYAQLVRALEMTKAALGPTFSGRLVPSDHWAYDPESGDHHFAVRDLLYESNDRVAGIFLQ